MTTIEGKVLVVSKIGGIKLEGDDNWYNAANDDIRKTVSNGWKDYKEKHAVVTLDDHKKYTDVNVGSMSEATIMGGKVLSNTEVRLTSAIVGATLVQGVPNDRLQAWEAAALHVENWITRRE